MAEFVIPCETLVRFSKILQDFPDGCCESFMCIRFEDDLVIATNRAYMAVEHIGGGNTGSFFLKVDEALLAQCKGEAAFSSRLTITVTEMLKHAVGKTTYGYVTPGNIGYFGEVSADWDRWASIVGGAVTPAEKPRGGMYWDVAGLETLVGSSPSGKVVFEEVIDTTRPTLIRDITDPNWIGLFNPHNMRETYQPATMPAWAKAVAK